VRSDSCWHQCRQRNHRWARSLKCLSHLERILELELTRYQELELRKKLEPELEPELEPALEPALEPEELESEREPVLGPEELESEPEPEPELHLELVHHRSDPRLASSWKHQRPELPALHLPLLHRCSCHSCLQ
jgi:hypothetical protein